jgi:hypothetical protein
MHNFKDSLKKGKSIEEKLDIFFSQWYDIESATLAQEREYGFDRLFLRNGTVKTVEYKADFWTARTGNIFIELEVQSKPGWAKKTIADYIIYSVIVNNEVDYVLIVPNTYLKEKLPEWEQLEKKVIQNAGFSGVGVLVSVNDLDYNIVKIKKV